MLKVLIADDNDTVRRSVKQIVLESLPISRVEEAIDGSSLLEKALSADWDIIVSDIGMPKLNGLQAMKQILQQRPQMKVLVMSIHSAEQYAKQVIRAGAAGYICKDDVAAELVNEIKRIVQLD